MDQVVYLTHDKIPLYAGIQNGFLEKLSATVRKMSMFWQYLLKNV